MGRRHVRPVKQTVPRKAVLIEVIRILAWEAWRAGRTATPLGYEGAFLHALRGSLILRYGLSWVVAHAEARQIVGEGLSRAGGKRPTWAEGQPEYTIQGGSITERTRCVNCGAPLEPQQKKFCSQLCGGNYNRRLALLREADEHQTARLMVQARL